MTGHTFNRDPDAFKLRHILEAPLLQFEDQVYDICLSATNEAGIEQVRRFPPWMELLFALCCCCCCCCCELDGPLP